jgi:hypothetical protein
MKIDSKFLARLATVLFSFVLGILIEYLWLGKDAFEAFGLILLVIFVAPIFLIAMSLEQKIIGRKRK